jgi:asparaginyl-tRNA synthetase
LWQVEAGRVTTGASVSIEGVLVESQGSKQKVELQASKLLLVRKAFMYSWFLGTEIFFAGF